MTKPINFDEKVRGLNGLHYGGTIYEVRNCTLPDYTTPFCSGLFFKRPNDSTAGLFVRIEWGAWATNEVTAEFRELEFGGGDRGITLTKIVIPHEYLTNANRFYHWLNLTIPNIEKI